MKLVQHPEGIYVLTASQESITIYNTQEEGMVVKKSLVISRQDFQIDNKNLTPTMDFYDQLLAIAWGSEIRIYDLGNFQLTQVYLTVQNIKCVRFLTERIIAFTYIQNNTMKVTIVFKDYFYSPSALQEKLSSKFSRA